MSHHHTAARVEQSPAVGLRRLPLHAGTRQLAADRALRSSRQVDTSTGVWVRVSELAAKDPRRVAVVTGAEMITYQQLSRRVDQIRAALLAERCGPGDRIAVAGPRSADTIAMFLAIESLGAAYLPLAPDWPVARVAGVLRHAQPRCLLLNGSDNVFASTVTQAAVEAHVPVVAAPVMCGDVGPHIAPRVVADNEPRYIIHTSGTTGRPKGAVVNQLGLMNHLWSMVARLRLTASDRVAFTASPAYVISIWQMLAVLLVGGSVSIVADADMRFARHLVASAAQTEVTVMELVPTVIGWIVHEARRRSAAPALPSLRCLISTGEKLDPGLAGGVLSTLPQAGFFNAYGSTECSDDVALHLVTSTDLAAPLLPVGIPVPNVAFYLLTDEGGTWRAAEPGETGELWIGGHAVGAGYLNDQERTRDSFFVDEFDPSSRTGRIYRTGDIAKFGNGIAYCLGRADRQVKIAGVRIELDEVEAAVSRIPGVLRCAVVAEYRGGGAQLVAYYNAESEISQENIFALLHSSLPKVMIPRHWMRIDDLPRNDNGKVDYRALVESGEKI
ncbi:hypothetical protein GCM10010193_40180 [Kitasatospora atroaurantiaca]|uniref:Amino acid adenylation domain-containing protein n=1 Tax=Kitasatospora atroaurantiaca TaxID=285545 RepID=A0A561EKR9_9ACTN|nr:amino acid adenylation domain-containing protein [Kitasatospora atroaurantiaca]TWE16223.1 amino acid adenylation domain-containing protein [Kitasatospora atroaurantiaca]